MNSVVFIEKTYSYNRLSVFVFRTHYIQGNRCNSVFQAATIELSYRKLDLSDCGLETIPKTVISTWVDLEELTLSENRINLEDASVRVLLELSLIHISEPTRPY